MEHGTNMVVYGKITVYKRLFTAKLWKFADICHFLPGYVLDAKYSLTIKLKI